MARWLSSSMFAALMILLVVLELADAEKRHNVRVDYHNERVVFNCTDQATVNGTVEVTHWLQAGKLQVLRAGEIRDGVEVSDDGQQLTIPRVDDDHLTEYYCQWMNEDGELVYSATNVYIYRPTFVEAYWLNLVIAFSASVIFLVIVITACVVYYKRCDPDPYGKESMLQETVMGSMPEYNGAKSYTIDTIC